MHLNLTQVSAYFKRYTKIGAIVIGGYYLWILVIVPASVGTFKAIFNRPAPPNPVYGLLDPLEFVEKSTLNSTPTFALNTKNGRLPSGFPVTMPVYKFKAKPFSYLSSDNALKDAAYLGFSESDLITDLKGTVFRWRNPITGTVLEIDKDSRRINQNTNLTGKSQDFVPGTITEADAKKKAIQLFKDLTRFNDTLYPLGFQNVVLGSYSGSKMTQTTATRDAEIARVDLYRKVGDYNILGPDPKKGLLNAFIRGNAAQNSQDVLNYPKIDANYTEIDTKSVATYSIIPISQAWKAVSAGQGIVVNVTPAGTNPFEEIPATAIGNVLIDNMYLAYYESIKPENFLQPIYVFEGKYTTSANAGGSIVIYFPAVAGENVKKIE